MFPNVKGMVFLFLGFLLFVGVFIRKDYNNRGFRQFGALLLGDFGLQHFGSIRGPHFGSYFWRHMWPTY